jgi:carboxypeptidase Q
MMLKKIVALALWVAITGQLGAAAMQQPGPDINARIRKEATENSQIMKTLAVFTDLYGPRLTGSPSLKAAGEWAIKQMRDWGFENAHLEPWDFGHPGWVNERLTAHIVSPVKDSLVCEVLAWTPGTNGAVTAQAFQVVIPERPATGDAPPERPTREELTAFLDGIKDQVKGKIVLLGRHQSVPVNTTPAPRRLDDVQARARYDPNNPNAGQPRQRPQPDAEPQKPGQLTPAQIADQVDNFLLASGALIKVTDAARDHGQIRAFSNRSYDPAKALPTVIMRNEDYGRISRLMASGRAVELEFNITNRLFPEGRTAYNAIAELPGTDKKDEVVMLGGHLDSWHAATGATDNAIGCAVMMEAARILKAIGVKPRRTIRVALWSGEEQGLLGSQAYVKEHFGSFENPKPAFFKFGGYFNIDSGTGRARGMSVFGPPEAATVLREILAPFEDLGVVGAIPSRSRGLGGSDNGSFNQAGLPGIGVGQDPIEYFTYTWHTNLDTYERVIEDDAKKSAIAIAAAVYQLAMRDELLPRFTKEKMPALPPSRQAPQQAQPATPSR